MPDTLFIKQGRFDYICTLDNQLCLSVDSRTKLNNFAVKLRMQEASKERKQDSVEFGLYKLLI